MGKLKHLLTYFASIVSLWLIILNPEPKVLLESKTLTQKKQQHDGLGSSLDKVGFVIVLDSSCGSAASILEWALRPKVGLFGRKRKTLVVSRAACKANRPDLVQVTSKAGDHVFLMPEHRTVDDAFQVLSRWGRAGRIVVIPQAVLERSVPVKTWHDIEIDLPKDASFVDPVSGVKVLLANSSSPFAEKELVSTIVLHSPDARGLNRHLASMMGDTFTLFTPYITSWSQREAALSLIHLVRKNRFIRYQFRTHKFSSKCLDKLTETENLHFNKWTWNQELKGEGFEVFEKMSEKFEPQDPAEGVRLVFMIMIHSSRDLELLEAWFSTWEAGIYNTRHHYLIIPDMRILFQVKTLQCLRKENVHLLPDEFVVKGSWGGMSLVYKELIGYMYSISHFRLSHVLLISASSVPLKSIWEIEPMMEIGKSYVAISDADDVERMQGLAWECDGGLFKIRNVTNLLHQQDDFVLKEGDQWKVLSWHTIMQIFVSFDVLIRFVERFQYSLVPDEHMIPSLLYHLQSHDFIEPQSLVNKKVVLVDWVHGRPSRLESSSIDLAGDTDFLFARKVVYAKDFILIVQKLHRERVASRFHIQYRHPRRISKRCEQALELGSITNLHTPGHALLQTYLGSMEEQDEDDEKDLVYIFIISNQNDLNLLDEAFQNASGMYDPSAHGYVIVPDARLPKSTLSRFPRNEVKVLPEELWIKGSWGGSSLVYKELLGYAFALRKFHKFNHAILLSATTIPIKTSLEIKQFLEPGKSYLEVGTTKMAQKDHIERHTNIAFDCDGSIVVREPRNEHENLHLRPMPDKIRQHFRKKNNNSKPDTAPDAGVESSPLRKGSQWKILSHAILQTLFLEKQQLLWSYLDFFDLTLVPDEHFLPTLFHNEIQPDSFRNMAPTLVFWCGWKPCKLTQTFLHRNQATIASTDQLFLRKVTSVHQLRQTINALKIGQTQRKPIQSKVKSIKRT